MRSLALHLTVGVVVVVALAIAAAGCVERRLIVRSDPPGARVYVDGEPKGEAPVAVPFTYYGTREVVLRHERHEPVRIVLAVDPPWYQLSPVDFFVEVLWPFTVLDEREVVARLAPAPPPDLDRARERAAAFWAELEMESVETAEPPARNGKKETN